MDTADAYRPLPAGYVAALETLGEAVAISAEGERELAAARRVEPRVRAADTPQLVRHIPHALQRLAVAGTPRSSRSRLWVVGAPLVVVGGVGLMAGPLLTAAGVGGALRWLWIALPLLLFAAGAWAFWTAMSRDSPRRLSRREKLSDALTGVFGITPRTRRRG